MTGLQYGCCGAHDGGPGLHDPVPAQTLPDQVRLGLHDYIYEKRISKGNYLRVDVPMQYVCSPGLPLQQAALTCQSQLLHLFTQVSLSSRLLQALSRGQCKRCTSLSFLTAAWVKRHACHLLFHEQTAKCWVTTGLTSRCTSYVGLMHDVTPHLQALCRWLHHHGIHKQNGRENPTYCMVCCQVFICGLPASHCVTAVVISSQ